MLALSIRSAASICRAREATPAAAAAGRQTWQRPSIANHCRVRLCSLLGLHLRLSLSVSMCLGLRVCLRLRCSRILSIRIVDDRLRLPGLVSGVVCLLLGQMLVVCSCIVIRPSRRPLSRLRQTAELMFVRIDGRAGRLWSAGQGQVRTQPRRLERFREFLASDERVQLGLLGSPSLVWIHVQQASHKVDE